MIRSPEDWPERTDYSRPMAFTRVRPGEDAKQAAVAAREALRIPESPQDAPPSLRRWRRLLRIASGGYCTACGKHGALSRIRHWRDGYETRRCRYCLFWDQRTQQSDHGGFVGGDGF